MENLTFLVCEIFQFCVTMFFKISHFSVEIHQLWLISACSACFSVSCCCRLRPTPLLLLSTETTEAAHDLYSLTTCTSLTNWETDWNQLRLVQIVSATLNEFEIFSFMVWEIFNLVSHSLIFRFSFTIELSAGTWQVSQYYFLFWI